MSRIFRSVSVFFSAFWLGIDRKQCTVERSHTLPADLVQWEWLGASHLCHTDFKMTYHFTDLINSFFLQQRVVFNESSLLSFFKQNHPSFVLITHKLTLKLNAAFSIHRVNFLLETGRMLSKQHLRPRERRTVGISHISHTFWVEHAI